MKKDNEEMQVKNNIIVIEASQINAPKASGLIKELLNICGVTVTGEDMMINTSDGRCKCSVVFSARENDAKRILIADDDVRELTAEAVNDFDEAILPYCAESKYKGVKCKVINYSLSNDRADLLAKNIKYGDSFVSFELLARGILSRIKIKSSISLPLRLVLAACYALVRAGIDIKDISASFLKL